MITRGCVFCFLFFPFFSWPHLLRKGYGDYVGLRFCFSFVFLFLCFSVFLFSWLDLLRKGYGEYIGLFSSFSVFSIFLRARLDEAEIIKGSFQECGCPFKNRRIFHGITDLEPGIW